jgi:hypothetical protein
MKHLSSSKKIFLYLVDKVRACDHAYVDELRAKRDYEELSLYVSEILMGVRQ